jgi:FMN phosphatase YigB (HAD superfamily)
LRELAMDPHRVLLVSDRDEYLKAGKDLGMLTCRLQPKNARRGNITAHYTSPSVQDVQEVVNDINGISFNTVLNR